MSLCSLLLSMISDVWKYGGTPPKDVLARELFFLKRSRRRTSDTLYNYRQQDGDYYEHPHHYLENKLERQDTHIRILEAKVRNFRTTGRLAARDLKCSLFRERPEHHARKIKGYRDNWYPLQVKYKYESYDDYLKRQRWEEWEWKN